MRLACRRSARIFAKVDLPTRMGRSSAMKRGRRKAGVEEVAAGPDMTRGIVLEVGGWRIEVAKGKKTEEETGWARRTADAPPAAGCEAENDGCDDQIVLCGSVLPSPASRA